MQEYREKLVVAAFLLVSTQGWVHIYKGRSLMLSQFHPYSLPSLAYCGYLLLRQLLLLFSLRWQSLLVVVAEVVVIVLREEDVIVVSIVASLVIDLTVLGESWQATVDIFCLYY